MFQISLPYIGFCPDPKHFIVNCEQNVVKFAGKWEKIQVCWKMQFLYKLFWQNKMLCRLTIPTFFRAGKHIYGPRQANLVLIAYACSEGSGEPAHLRSLARTFAARSYKQWVKRNLQTESQIPGPSEWLGMRSWNLSWRNARRHQFAWRGSYIYFRP